MSESARRVDNYLQEELFEPTLLLMPTTTRSHSVSGEKKASTKREAGSKKRSPQPRNANAQPTWQPRPQERGVQASLDLPQDPPVRVVKSKRRKRHIAAYRQSGEIVISVPFRTTRAEISALIPEMVARVIAGEERSRTSEAELDERARSLISTYLPEFTVRPASISWRPMNERWGSCTTVDRTIRLSERLQNAPDYVIDCVLFHELIHLEIPGHGQDFQALLARYPDLARAESFLEGFEAGERGL